MGLRRGERERERSRLAARPGTDADFDAASVSRGGEGDISVVCIVQVDTKERLEMLKMVLRDDVNHRERLTWP